MLFRYRRGFRRRRSLSHDIGFNIKGINTNAKVKRVDIRGGGAEKNLGGRRGGNRPLGRRRRNAGSRIEIDGIRNGAGKRRSRGNENGEVIRVTGNRAGRKIYMRSGGGIKRINIRTELDRKVEIGKRGRSGRRRKAGKGYKASGRAVVVIVNLEGGGKTGVVFKREKSRNMEGKDIAGVVAAAGNRRNGSRKVRRIMAGGLNKPAKLGVASAAAENFSVNNTRGRVGSERKVESARREIGRRRREDKAIKIIKVKAFVVAGVDIRFGGGVGRVERRRKIGNTMVVHVDGAGHSTARERKEVGDSDLRIGIGFGGSKDGGVVRVDVRFGNNRVGTIDKDIDYAVSALKIESAADGSGSVLGKVVGLKILLVDSIVIVGGRSERGNLVLAHGKIAAHGITGFGKLAVNGGGKLLGSERNRGVGIVTRILLGGKGFVRGVSFGKSDVVINIREEGSGESIGGRDDLRGKLVVMGGAPILDIVVVRRNALLKLFRGDVANTAGNGVIDILLGGSVLGVNRVHHVLDAKTHLHIDVGKRIEVNILNAVNGSGNSEEKKDDRADKSLFHKSTTV